MSDFAPDMDRVHALAADSLRRWMRNLGPIDLGWYGEEGDWPELYGEAQLPERHQHLFMAAIEEAVRTAVATFIWPATVQSENADPAPIDAAIEQVVRAGSSDRQALTAAVRELAGTLGYNLTAKAPEQAIHSVGTTYVWLHKPSLTVVACGAKNPEHRAYYNGEITCPGCLAALSGDDGYETDPEPKPTEGEHGTCVCGGAIHYIDCPTGGWWAHDEHPADGHDAVLGGPA
jgi:hypothetical protein